MVEEGAASSSPFTDNLPDILIVTTVIMGYNGKGVAILQTDGGLIKQRTPDRNTPVFRGKPGRIP